MQAENAGLRSEIAAEGASLRSEIAALRDLMNERFRHVEERLDRLEHPVVR